MKKVILLSFSLLILTVGIYAQEAMWSKPVNGVRARLFILPPDKPNSPFCRVMIEIENVENVMGQRKIRFDTDRLSLNIADKNGKPLARPTALLYDGLKPIWEPILLPYAGSIKFQVSFPGVGYRPGEKMILDMGPSQSWVIPQNGASYWVSGKIVIPAVKGDHPYIDWSGTLELPPVLIPKIK